jgi:hypothetical protein
VPLRLLHVSDIHFQGYGTDWDYDSDQRRELLRDVRDQVSVYGPIDGILVGGDIAFRAGPAEYEAARRWLDDLRAACGDIDTGRVWTVPGNHDVDRTAISSSVVLKQFRADVRACAVDDLDMLLRQRLVQDPAAAGLIEPLAQYNAFAGEYHCSVTCKQPHWYDDTTLTCDGLSVRLLGLNSVLISDQDDSESDEGKLVLGTWQCVPPREDGTIHIAIAHHPPSWVRDWDVVEPYLRRVHLMLFGHEHAFAAQQSVPRGSVEVHAGAVGPERDNARMPGGMYAPSYNVLTLERVTTETVHLVVRPRCWNHDITAFVGHPDGDSDFDVSVEQPPTGDLRDVTPPYSVAAADEGAPPVSPTSLTEGVPAAADPPPRSANPLAADTAEVQAAESASEGVQPAAELRKIATDFMRRPWTDRVEIARRLSVLDDRDLQLPETELFPLVLRRIRDANLANELIEELDHG